MISNNLLFVFFYVILAASVAFTSPVNVAVTSHMVNKTAVKGDIVPEGVQVFSDTKVPFPYQSADQDISWRTEANDIDSENFLVDSKEIELEDPFGKYE